MPSVRTAGGDQTTPTKRADAPPSASAQFGVTGERPRSKDRPLKDPSSCAIRFRACLHAVSNDSRHRQNRLALPVLQLETIDHIAADIENRDDSVGIAGALIARQWEAVEHDRDRTVDAADDLEIDDLTLGVARTTRRSSGCPLQALGDPILAVGIDTESETGAGGWNMLRGSNRVDWNRWKDAEPTEIGECCCRIGIVIVGESKHDETFP